MGAAPRATRTASGRLEFLDALRGLAALVVAVQHIGERIWPGLMAFSHYWWRPGEFGVFVFFMCSGFIIPASLERRNDLREFWIGRVFRLFPLYLSVLLVALIAFATPWAAMGAGFRPVEDTLVNATMLQIFTTRPLMIGATWTLGYEMAFYLSVTVLFMARWHRRSATTALLLLAGALAVGPLHVPLLLVQTVPRLRPEAALVVAVAVLVVCLRVRGRQRVVAALLTAVVVTALLNRPHDAWFSALLLASMFVGTVLYRYDAGERPRWVAVSVFATAVGAITLVEFLYHVGAPDPTTGVTPRWWTEAGTFVSAYAVFGLLFLLRRRSFPRALIYLGTISYSVYLVHAVVLLLPRPSLPAVPEFAVLLGITIGVSALTFRFIERPGQMFGRAVISRLRERRRVAATVQPADGRPPLAGPGSLVRPLEPGGEQAT